MGQLPLRRQLTQGAVIRIFNCIGMVGFQRFCRNSSFLKGLFIWWGPFSPVHMYKYLLLQKKNPSKMQLVNQGHKAIQTDRRQFVNTVVEISCWIGFHHELFKQKAMVVAPPFWVWTDWRTDGLTDRLTVSLLVAMSAVVSNRNSRLYLFNTLWQQVTQLFTEIN